MYAVTFGVGDFRCCGFTWKHSYETVRFPRCVYAAKHQLPGGPGSRQRRDMPQIGTAMITYRTVNVQGLNIFYREARSSDAPAVLLLHGFPSSSRMYDKLMR